MAKERTPDRSDGLADPPIDVQITVLARRDGPALRDRLVGPTVRKRAGAVAILALVVALGSAIAVGLQPGHRNAAPRRVAALASVGAPAGVAATYGYGYPFRCLTVTLDAHDQTFARADVNHRSYCGRFYGYTTAVFHRVGGRWRQVLDASAYWCPTGSIPRAVRLELGICRQTGRFARGTN